jgi:hypothetical protein
MQQKFYFSKDGKQMGPWTHSEGLQQIDAGHVAWSDYVYDESQAEWILISEHKSFAQAFSGEKRVPRLNKEAEKTEVSNKDWYVLKDENRYGPFSYLEIVKLLQEKNLFIYDFIWNKDLPNWTKISDCEQFATDKIKQLHASQAPYVDEVFFQRRHARAKYASSVIVHNNKLLWKGRSLELSEGGAGLLIESTKIEPGQTIFLHFKVGEDVPPFNAVCTVISKQILPSGHEVKYGVKFTSISRDVQEAIKNYTGKAA